MLAFLLSIIENDAEKIKFEEIYNSYKKQIGMLAFSILKNQQDTEDVVHDVFYSVASSHMNIITQAKCEEDIRNYLLKSVKNASLSLLRKRKVRADFEEKQKNTIKLEISDEEFLDMICAKIDSEEFIKILEKLENKYRDVLYYKLVLEMTSKEISDLVGISSNTVRQQIARGKKILIDIICAKEENANGDDKK